MCLLGKYKLLLENVFYTLIMCFFRYHPSKLELEALAGTIAAVTRTSGPNIYITRTVKRTGKVCGRHNERSKTSLLRRLQAQTLPDEAPPMGKIHPFSKIAVTFEPVMRFRCPSGFKIFFKIVTL